MIFWWILPDGLDWWFHIRCLFEKQYEEHWRLTFMISLHHYAPAQFLWTHSAIFGLIVRPTRRRKRTPTPSCQGSDSFRGLQSGWKWFERHTGKLVPWVGSFEFEQIPLSNTSLSIQCIQSIFANLNYGWAKLSKIGGGPLILFVLFRACVNTFDKHEQDWPRSSKIFLFILCQTDWVPAIHFSAVAFFVVPFWMSCFCSF